MLRKVDNWSELERQYVVDGKTHREIARKANISNSTVSAKARKDDWEGKRISYRNSLQMRAYEQTADAVAHQQTEVLAENILVARAYIRTFAQQLAEGKVNTNAKDTLDFIKFLAGEMNPERGEAIKDGPKIIEGAAQEAGDRTEFLRRIVETARARLATGGGLGGDLLGESPGTLKN